jgi:hypothetical protein
MGDVNATYSNPSFCIGEEIDKTVVQPPAGRLAGSTEEEW